MLSFHSRPARRLCELKIRSASTATLSRLAPLGMSSHPPKDPVMPNLAAWGAELARYAYRARNMRLVPRSAEAGIEERQQLAADILALAKRIEAASLPSTVPPLPPARRPFRTGRVLVENRGRVREVLVEVRKAG